MVRGATGGGVEAPHHGRVGVYSGARLHWVPGPKGQGLQSGQLGWRRGCWWGHSPPLPRAGIQRFCRDIHMMLGFKPGLYFRACWLFLSPATLLVMGGKEGCWLGPRG